MNNLYLCLGNSSLYFLCNDTQLIACEEFDNDHFADTVTNLCKEVQISSVKIILFSSDYEEIASDHRLASIASEINQRLFIGKDFKDDLDSLDSLFTNLGITDIQYTDASTFSLKYQQEFVFIVNKDSYSYSPTKLVGNKLSPDLCMDERIAIPLSNLAEVPHEILCLLQLFFDSGVFHKLGEVSTLKKAKVKLNSTKKQGNKEKPVHNKTKAQFNNKKIDILLTGIIVLLVFLISFSQAVGKRYTKALANLNTSTTKNQIVVMNMTEMKSYLTSYLNKYDSTVYSTYSKKLLATNTKGCVISDIKMEQEDITITCFAKKNDVFEKYVDTLKKQFKVKTTEHVGLVDVENKTFNKYCVTLAY